MAEALAGLSVSTAGGTPSGTHHSLSTTRGGTHLKYDVYAEANELREIFVSTLKFMEWVRNSLDTFKQHLLGLAFPLVMHSILEIGCFDDAAAQACDLRGLEGVAPLLVGAVQKLLGVSGLEDASNNPSGAPRFASALVASRTLLETITEDFLPAHASEIAALSVFRLTTPSVSDPSNLIPRADRRQQLFAQYSERVRTWTEGNLIQKAKNAFGGDSGVDGVDLCLIPRLLDPALKFKVSIPLWALKLALDYLMRRNCEFLLRVLNDWVQIESRDMPPADYFDESKRTTTTLPMKLTTVVSGIARTAEAMSTGMRRTKANESSANLPEAVQHVLRWGVVTDVRRHEGVASTSFIGNADIRTVVWPDYGSTAYGRCLSSACSDLLIQPPTSATFSSTAATGSTTPTAVSGVKRSRQAVYSSVHDWRGDSLRVAHLSALPKRVSAAAITLTPASTWSSSTAAGTSDGSLKGWNAGLRQIIAAGLSDGSLRVWATISLAIHSAKGGDRTMQFSSSPSLRAYGRVTAVDVSPDGDFVLCGTCTGQIVLFSLQTQLRSGVKAALAEFKTGGHTDASRYTSVLLEPMCVYRHSLHMPVWSVRFCPLTPKVFLSGGRDGTAKLWSTSEELPQLTFAWHCSDVSVAIFHPNGLYSITGSDDSLVRIYDNGTGECLRLFAGHGSRISALCCAPAGKFIASGDRDGVIRIWDAPSGACIIELRSQHTAPVTALAFHPAGRRLVSSDASGRVCFWDVAEHIARFAGPTYETAHTSTTTATVELGDRQPRAFVTDENNDITCVSV